MSVFLPELTVTGVITELASIYANIINKKQELKSIPSPFLWGPPGIGKSDGVLELATMLEDMTGKRVSVTEIRLLLFSPIDLRGVPVADVNREFTDWLKPRILDLSASDEVINLLFLDELSAAPSSVQAAAYQLTLNRAIGEHKLPDNTIVIGAGNRTTDRSVAYKMPAALANRMMHFEIKADYRSWVNWAIANGDINSLVLGYLSYDSSKLYVEERSIDEVAFPSPRSWMFVSNILNAMDASDNIENYHSVIASCIGMGTAMEFIGWSRVLKDLPDAEKIASGMPCKCPKTPDAIYALVSVMSSYVTGREKHEKTGISMEELENLCAFCNQMPADYGLCFYQNILAAGDVRMKLMKVQEFSKWSKKHNLSVY